MTQKSGALLISENFPESYALVYPNYKNFKEGTNEIVFVSFVESTMKFFVQLESETKMLEETMDNIKQISKSTIRA